MASSGSLDMFALACLTFLLLTLSTRARYYLKMLTFLIGSLFLATFLPIPLFILRPRDYRNALMPAWGCRWLCRILGASFEVRGIENINKSKGGVILINHQSCIDLAVLAYLWPVIGRATAVSRKEVLYLFPFGLAAYLWGTLYINRSNKSDALNKLNKESKAINERGCKLLFFPEGTRHQGDKLLPFKKGAFFIAVQSQSMIQPVVVSKYTFLNAEKKSFGRGHSIISILPEIDCTNLTKDDLSMLIDETYEKMQTKFEEITNERREATIHHAKLK